MSMTLIESLFNCLHGIFTRNSNSNYSKRFIISKNKLFQTQEKTFWLRAEVSPLIHSGPRWTQVKSYLYVLARFLQSSYVQQADVLVVTACQNQLKRDEATHNSAINHDIDRWNYPHFRPASCKKWHLLQTGCSIQHRFDIECPRVLIWRPLLHCTACYPLWHRSRPKMRRTNYKSATSRACLAHLTSSVRVRENVSLPTGNHSSLSNVYNVHASWVISTRYKLRLRAGRNI